MTADPINSQTKCISVMGQHNMFKLSTSHASKKWGHVGWEGKAACHGNDQAATVATAATVELFQDVYLELCHQFLQEYDTATPAISQKKTRRR